MSCTGSTPLSTPLPADLLAEAPPPPARQGATCAAIVKHDALVVQEYGYLRARHKALTELLKTHGLAVPQGSQEPPVYRNRIFLF